MLTGLGVKIVQLVTDDPDAARCPAYRSVSTSCKDWVLIRPRDLPCGCQFAGVAVEEIRAVDHDIAPGVRPDMTEHGWAPRPRPACRTCRWAAEIIRCSLADSVLDR